MSWQNQLKGDSLSWVLETKTPEVRYLALRDLLDIRCNRFGITLRLHSRP